MDRPGYELPLLLVGAFRALIDELHRELAERGHPDARPIHGFALQAIGPDGVTTSELGRRLGISKQGAAKTAAGLEQIDYISREGDPEDARAVVLKPTARGHEFLALSATIFDRLRAEWSAELGAQRLAALEDDLRRIVVPSGTKLGDLPGWLR
ncbi:MAG TPA: MarR family winged helix-turn-helix transcriptional regulator [Acidimicrobiales bacterium]